MNVTITLFSTGWCVADESHLLAGGRRGARVSCPALVALVEHPDGLVLFDTGYAPRLFDAGARWPYRLYLRATPVTTSPDMALVAQLAARGIAAGDIHTVVLSHFHADHLAGLADFPDARIVCAADALADISGKSGFPALRRAFLPDLLPASCRAQIHPLADSDFDDPIVAGLEPLGATFDLFGDRALRLIRLPGHARGQIGLFAQTVDGPALLLADAAYQRRSIRENRPPSPITRFFVDDFAAMKATLAVLHECAVQRPDLRLIPTHCPEAAAEAVPLPASVTAETSCAS